MNQKVTLPALAAAISRRSGLSKRVCEEFVRELFEMITDSLRDGESVRIQDLGTFRLSVVEPRMSIDVSSGQPIEIAGHKKVLFIPDRILAASVNAPFEAFEPQELPDDIDETTLALLEEVEELPADIQGAEQPDETRHNEDSGTSELPDNFYSLPEDGDMEPVVTDSDHETASTEQDHGTAETEQEPETVITDPVTEPAVEEPERVPAPATRAAIIVHDGPQLEPPRKRLRFGWGFIFGFASCLALCGLAAFCYYLFHSDRQPDSDTVAEIIEIKPIVPLDSLQASDSTMTADSLRLSEGTDAGQNQENGEGLSGTPSSQSDHENEPTAKPVKPVNADTQPSDKVIYDTISRTRYLTTMAKQHYGDYNLWPYIYEENKSFLGHPDRIRPGTPVVIPRLSKYGVDPKNPADIEKAKKKGYAIYARYNKGAVQNNASQGTKAPRNSNQKTAPGKKK